MRRYICKIISVLMLVLFPFVAARAEDSYKDKTFCFVYIAHQQLTAINPLVEYLDSRYERAVSTEDFVLVIYLANGSSPYMVEVNTESDNRDDYNDLVKELRGGRLHRIDDSYDLEALLALFERLDFVAPASDDLKYGAVDWHFHVTSDFWDKGYNESVIARLCFVMGVDRMTDENFRLRCYFSRYDEVKADPEYPFGYKDYCNVDFQPYYY